jgi:large subunit ribosomal protein L24
MSIKKGDLVMVISGREKGKTGRIQRIDKENERVWIEKTNLVKRHQRPTQQLRQGGIIEKEAPIHISNVMFYDEKLAKPTRLGWKAVDGNKVRVSKKSGEVVDAK